MKKIIFTLFLACVSVLNLKAQGNQAAITNGFPIAIQNVPYQVSLQHNGEHYCGGSIINNHYVLTAAHCVNRINASDINVKVGFSLQDNPGTNVQSFGVKRMVIHPNDDIAIIEINGTFIFNNFVYPVELISNQKLFAETVGNEARVSGWGWTVPNQDISANQLQAVDVPIISNQNADNQLDISSPSHRELTQRMIATGAVGVDRAGACHATVEDL